VTLKGIRGVWVEMNGDHLAGDRKDRTTRARMNREDYGPSAQSGARLLRPVDEGGEVRLMPGDYDRLVS
jgi:hypothetical protein